MAGAGIQIQVGLTPNPELLNQDRFTMPSSEGGSLQFHGHVELCSRVSVQAMSLVSAAVPSLHPHILQPSFGSRPELQQGGRGQELTSDLPVPLSAPAGKQGSPELLHKYLFYQCVMGGWCWIARIPRMVEEKSTVKGICILAPVLRPGSLWVFSNTVPKERVVCVMSEETPVWVVPHAGHCHEVSNTPEQC